ncbi:hypothetical protein C1645_346191 [Glomus cerebriforme]|uniref:DNA/RNA-binding protein Alba-like domain-containing protein n=1 Tax=Glomus cerebriforme TaxID=658196 RepID=A0A397TP50_9GLOM|nr:hypothetical protein C1645_346191 [Glomus cerebriforme]
MSSKDLNLVQDSTPQQKKNSLKNIQPKKLIKIVQSSKIKKYVEIALSIFQDESCFTSENVIVIFSGKGPAINKTITIVEIIKRKLNGSLHQYTQIGRNFLAQDEGEDDDNEMILDHENQKEQDRSRDNLPEPVITIYLCSKMIPHLEETLGYQLPTTT